MSAPPLLITPYMCLFVFLLLSPWEKMYMASMLVFLYVRFQNQDSIGLCSQELMYYVELNARV